MLDQAAFLTGAGHFLLAFGLACIFLLAFKLIYQAVTPYNEKALIRAGNAAVSITLGGALIGFALPVASALSETASLIEFAAWAALAGVIQIVAFLIVRTVAVRDLQARVEAGELPVAIYLASVSIAVGLLNAASMTY